MAKVIFFLLIVGAGLVFFVVKKDLINVDELLRIVAVPDDGAAPTESGETSPFPSDDSITRPTFPMDRTLIDNQGRPLEASVLGKSNGSILVKRKFDQKEFVIALTKLSSADQEFFANVADYKPIPSKASLVAGRVARWNTNLSSAQKEATKYGLPIYLVFTGTSWCPPCQQMERSVFNSDTFRKFANENLVLLKVTVPASLRLSGLDAQLSAKFGISSYPTILLLDASGNSFYKKSGASVDPVGHTAYIKQRIDQTM